MCGIFGVVNQNINESLAYTCLNELIHRGPDGGRIWQEDNVTLGHRRLAILDLSEKGSQPMSYGDGRYMLTFNGEIYNFLEIRQKLIKRGYTFTSDSDSEVILAAYTEWGETCVKDFNGMWAFAIWDRLLKKVFISRDRFGVKPLYYMFTDKEHTSIAFASEMKALMPLLADEAIAKSRGVDKGASANKNLVCDPNRIVYYESTKECVLNDVYRLPAGCNAVMCISDDEADLKAAGEIINDGKPVKPGELVIKRYWNTLDHLVDIPRKYDEQVEMLRHLFLDACRLRMRSDVTIGTALSGGLDSSATICAMSYLSQNEKEFRMSGDWQHAYVAAFPGTVQDESEYAKKVTDYLGINSTFINIDPVSAIDDLEKYVYLQEDVYLTSPIPMMLLYKSLREGGTIVTIDGHGADELFGGYTFDFIKALADARTPGEKKMVMTAYIESFPKDGSNLAMKSPTAWGVRKDMLVRRLADVKNAKKEPYKKVRAASDSRYKKMDTLGQTLYASSHETILPTLLRNYDRYSMASSVEIRMPFMDHRVVSLAMSLPWQSRLHDGYSKSIIRDAMQPYMPEDICYRRTKIGFNSPIVEWMKGPLKSYFTDIIESSDFINCDLIDSDKVKNMISKVIYDDDATFAMGESAFSALYPYLWEKGFLKGKKWDTVS